MRNTGRSLSCVSWLIRSKGIALIASERNFRALLPAPAVCAGECAANASISSNVTETMMVRGKGMPGADSVAGRWYTPSVSTMSRQREQSNPRRSSTGGLRKLPGLPGWLNLRVTCPVNCVVVAGSPTHTGQSRSINTLPRGGDPGGSSDQFWTSSGNQFHA